MTVMTMPLKKLAFALANTAAVLAALYVAFARDLERPYWAMFTVFIVAKPISGAVRSKAVYRFCGTSAGAAVALLLIPPLVQSPVLLCLAISVWVGACLYVSLLDRTPRSYAFLLAGYTATLVGLAVVDKPETIFDTSVARLEEISVGLICAAIAHSVLFPRNVLEELNEKIARTLRVSTVWLSEALRGLQSYQDVGAQQRLAQVVTELHLLYTHVAFETSDVPRASGVMRALLDRLALLTPRLSSVQQALTALSAQGPVPPAIVDLLDGASLRLRSLVGVEPSKGDPALAESDLKAEFARACAESLRAESPDWRALLEQTIITNVRELLVAVEDCGILADALNAPGRRLPRALERETAARGRRGLPRDHGLAFLSACAAAGATLIACVLWIAGSWPEGAVAAQFAAIGCSLFATLDNPAKPIWTTIVAIILALPLAAVYEFAIFPQIDGFGSLALVLTPVLLLFSFMMTFERLEGAAFVLAIGFSGGLALQSSYRADFAAFVNSNTAEIGGLLIAAATNLIFRTFDPVWNARRLSKAGWRSVRNLAAGKRIDIRRWVLQMFDRLGMVTSRLKDRGAGLAGRDIDGLRDLRVGLNVAVLRGAEARLGGSHRSLEGVLRAICHNYRSRVRGRRTEQSDLERSIDLGITTVCREPPTRPVLKVLAALTGLRLDLAAVGTRYQAPLPAA
jgi:uncharacterized membrane protein YccC